MVYSSAYACRELSIDSQISVPFNYTCGNDLSKLLIWDGSNYCIECFHMTSRRPYWCPKTMKRRPCWCPKPVLWELNSFLMQTRSFVPINLHICWPREWKHSIVKLWINFRALFTYALPCEERIYLGRSKSAPPPATYTYACINL